MVQYIFTPWRDQAELLAVRRQLYPSHHPTQPTPTSDEATRRKQEAVARVSMWMQRGNCPHLVESTALLEAAILSDARATSEPSLAGSSGSYAARAAYSAAFSRFVTGLMDSHQDKARKMSMYAVAKSVGLPATFVELRHQATHEQLPSLTRLRAAAEKALDWIYEYYWKHLDEASHQKDGTLESGGSAQAASATACRALLMEMFTTEDQGTEGRIRAELGKRKGKEVLAAAMEINETARSAKLIGKSAVFMRELLEEEKRVSAQPMDVQEPVTARNIEAVRNMLQEDRMEVEQTLTNARVSEEEEQAPRVVDEGPAWSRYDRRGWVPKPIGIV